MYGQAEDPAFISCKALSNIELHYAGKRYRQMSTNLQMPAYWKACCSCGAHKYMHHVALLQANYWAPVDCDQLNCKCRWQSNAAEIKELLQPRQPPPGSQDASAWLQLWCEPTRRQLKKCVDLIYVPKHQLLSHIPCIPGDVLCLPIHPMLHCIHQLQHQCLSERHLPGDTTI